MDEIENEPESNIVFDTKENGSVNNLIRNCINTVRKRHEEKQ